MIQRRRLMWVGHLLRLDEETPARQALEEATRRVKLVKGGQKSTWIQGIKIDLEEAGLKSKGHRCIQTSKRQEDLEK